MIKIWRRHRALFFILLLALVLRVFTLGLYPVGLYSDEAAFGYNAELLFQTGRDEYGRFWPVSFESFGDWKPAMQGWLAIPFIAIFGLNEVSVRLPSAILGTATILVIYFLAKEMFDRQNGFMASWLHGLKSRKSNERLGTMKQCNNVAIIAAFLLAISPWHIFMSRIAMLVAVEVFFVSLGVLGLVRSMESGVRSRASKYLNWWLVLASASFAGAIYSYYGSRVTVPLILLAFTLVYFNELKKRWRELIFPVTIAAMLLSPLLIQSIGEPLILTGRAKTTSVFFNDNVRLQLWDAHTKAGLKKIPPLISRFFDNKPYYYARDITHRYLSHFSPIFLFFRGDSSPPFKIPRLGYLHIVDLPFFIFGIILLRRRLKQSSGKKETLFLILYLIISPFVASLTFLTPAANRSFNLVIPWTLITAYGLLAILTMKQFNNLAMRVTIVSFYLISLTAYSYSYIRIIPQELPHHWHYGRKELVNKLKPLLTEYDSIYLTNKGGPPYILLAFYLNIPPKEFHETVMRNPIINELGWGHVDKILNITIPREFSWSEVPKDKDALYVGFEDEIPESQVDILDRVYYPNGKAAYLIVKLK